MEPVHELQGGIFPIHHKDNGLNIHWHSMLGKQVQGGFPFLVLLGIMSADRIVRLTRLVMKTPQARLWPLSVRSLYFLIEPRRIRERQTRAVNPAEVFSFVPPRENAMVIDRFQQPCVPVAEQPPGNKAPPLDKGLRSCLR